MGREAIVVGGGIGGLAAARALGLRGWEVAVLEKARDFGAVGAGISICPNGLRALDALGLGAVVRARALAETTAGIRTPSGRWLSRTDTREFERRFGPLVVLHRADLVDSLRAAVPDHALHVDTEVEEVRTVGAKVEVVHRRGTVRADLVIAADGLHSSIRTRLWPDAPRPRYVGYTAWRLVVSPPRPVRSGGETWGRGQRIGLAPLPDGRVYLYAAASVPAGQCGDEGELAELRRRFGSWHDPIPELLAAATESAVLRHDILELPHLASFANGRIALLGDAAHAMTPDLGQGANQALEDALTLAAALDSHQETAAALAAYDRARRPRVQGIAERSHLMGALAQRHSLPAVAARNLALRLLPGRVMLNSLAPTLDWHPPR
ncbi:FAD-dependent monooxygenase [Nocardia sp. CC201C]|uniref:FAD-dependent monooxygenase n=1 Tax=Nocardia sp. CC201C TaxID=3044575 RepID=UPI0024A81AF4|nr:FAD-dependent monooxygenase [Nocardia sp. CC201C]